MEMRVIKIRIWEIRVGLWGMGVGMRGIRVILCEEI